METHAYIELIERQQRHWWYKGRRVILKSILNKYLSPSSLKILEIGCGTGGNLSLLKQYGTVSAMEMNPFAAAYAAKLSGMEIKTGRLPDNIPFKEQFDVICLFDVLEHIADDKSAFLKTSKMLKPGGIIVLTVPAHKWLYGIHDTIAHHFRRYSSADLKKLSINEMNLLRFSHFNFILFPFLILSRLIDKRLKAEKSAGYQTPVKLINTLLCFLFSLEKHLITKMSFPFGGSAFAVLKKQVL
jgi:SAM-dependent methyltransferase